VQILMSATFGSTAAAKQKLKRRQLANSRPLLLSVGGKQQTRRETETESRMEAIIIIMAIIKNNHLPARKRKRKRSRKRERLKDIPRNFVPPLFSSSFCLATVSRRQSHTLPFCFQSIFQLNFSARFSARSFDSIFQLSTFPQTVIGRWANGGKSQRGESLEKEMRRKNGRNLSGGQILTVRQSERVSGLAGQ